MASRSDRSSSASRRGVLGLLGALGFGALIGLRERLRVVRAAKMGDKSAEKTTKSDKPPKPWIGHY